MVFDLSKVTGLGDYTKKTESLEGHDHPDHSRTLYYKGEKAFLVVNPHTLELRCDSKLSNLLKEKYESVMESRYFGKGGIEIVPAGQLDPEELNDLVRLSYNLTN